MHMISSGLTDTGRVRAGNEDAFLIRPSILIVADGMGGAAAGEVASSLAVSSIATTLKDAVPSSEKEAEDLLHNAIDTADLLLRSAVKRNPSLDGMGTTVVTALHLNEKVIIGYVGDSRAYLISGESAAPGQSPHTPVSGDAETGIHHVAAPTRQHIVRVTDDHSVVMDLVRAEIITEEDIRSHPFRNRITRCVGCAGEHAPEFRTITVKAGDILILCSDGLWEMVHEDLILAIAGAASTPEDLCTRLVSAANGAGGQDNITVIAAVFSEE